MPFTYSRTFQIFSAFAILGASQSLGLLGKGTAAVFGHFVFLQKAL